MKANRGSLNLVMLILLFGAPVALAWLFLLQPSLLPSGRANFGQLINPPVPTTLTGSWTLLVPQDVCNEECQKVHTIASVVRRALGAEAFHRVRGSFDCSVEETRATCAAVKNTVNGEATLVVIDPMGNAVLRYGPALKPKDLLKDMQRLLAASREWRSDGNQ